jgi:hypothetical protein
LVRMVRYDGNDGHDFGGPTLRIVRWLLRPIVVRAVPRVPIADPHLLSRPIPRGYGDNRQAFHRPSAVGFAADVTDNRVGPVRSRRLPPD